MSYYKNILICGGDKRQVYMAKLMKSRGVKVSTFALNKENEITLSDINKFDVVILPVPVSKDGIHLNAPFVSYKIKLEDILKDKLATSACKAAVKGGMDLTKEEVDALFAMMDGDMRLKCPHGRPVVVKWTKKELEKMFKRIV